MVSGPETQQPVINQVTEEKIKVAIHPEYPEQTIAIGSILTEEGQTELCGLLRRNLDIFAWKPADMTGVPRHIAEHRLNIRIMKEVHYHSWLSNPVMVKKHDDSWRMCVDFKDLNKACPKDGYPLPKIDWKEDEEKTTFITSQGIFCYSKIPFGLKNAEETYQRLVDKAFHKQIGQNLEVYVDDLVIKSRTEREIIRDIEKTFKTLREINMKLNPKKCTFGVREGIFLGYKVHADGLKVCPDMVEAVLSFPSPKCLKDVQRLNEKLASLNRFLSKSAKRSLPFFKTLKRYTKKNDFQWTAEAETAFEQMKKLIAELPMLTAPKEKEELIIYLAATKEAISAVLMMERDGKQVPIYFFSRALQGLEINYTLMEKLILALVTRRLLKWSFELGEYDIHYRPRTSVKEEILADFIMEHPEDDPPDTPMEDKEELLNSWVLFTDGSSCIDGFGAGLILTNPEGAEFTYTLRFRFTAMANQVNGSYIAKEPQMIKYLEKVRALTSTFKEFSIKQVPRGENKKADALSKMASTCFVHPSKQVLVEQLKEKSINEKEVLAVEEEEGCTWMTPIHEYLMEEILPEEKRKARAIRRKAGRYAVTNGILYKKSFLGPWLCYVGPLQANYVLREIHEGSCSMHAGPRSVVAKALRLGYYWPTMHADAMKLIRECNSYQVYRPVPRNPQQNLTPITSP
ncbi:reverse transcriptase domain-containing protein [Tanacetum coccineum]